MGLTTSLRPFDDCTDAQVACKQAPNGNGPDGEPEVSDNILRLVLFYTRNLAVPARRGVNTPQVLAGKTCSIKLAAKVATRPRSPRPPTPPNLSWPTK